MKSFNIACVGYEIAADWYEGAPGKHKVLLVLVGYTSTKANYHELVTALVKKSGYAALVIDYTGHGDSPFELKDLTPAQNFLEVITAYDWLAAHHPELKISVMGTSYGGFLAMQLVKYRSPEKLVLRVPAMYPPETFYTKWKDMDTATEFHEYRAKAEGFLQHPLLGRASSYKGKTFVLTHEFDESCPKVSTDAVAEAFGAVTWEAKGFVHGLGKSTYSQNQLEEYQDKIVDWLA